MDIHDKALIIIINAEKRVTSTNRLECARWARQQRHGRRAKVIETNAKDDNGKCLCDHHLEHD